MEGGLPLLNCLLQQTLRSLCSYSDPSNSSSSSSSSKWVYAVFWRIVPRNYPPPKWDYGGSALDRSKGNKRNWILVWEDGFCDFHECEREGSGSVKGRFGADIFFKMSHEVYSYGEGLVGKVAADNSHKWVFREKQPESDPNCVSSWTGSTDPQPRQWELQFNSGIQTIAVISVREGIIQLGSLDKIPEDLNLVISVQRKFSYLQSIPGVLAMQRPYPPIQHSNTITHNSYVMDNNESAEDQRNVSSGKRCLGERLEELPIKSVNLGWNSPQTGIGNGARPFWQIPPLLPPMSWSLGALLSKLPSVFPLHNTVESSATAIDTNISSTAGYQKTKMNAGKSCQISDIKLEPGFEEEKPKILNQNSSLKYQTQTVVAVEKPEARGR
ncbi:PREDICTED: uncharacterized protein LOC104607041 [Nelumbo nucifera]|uniref:Transcription factor MYC/MYB N-terminal domain-containing protein n=2 Tax=Nelumbo nucifera TaxID=4432 RepID=A0A822Z9V0_NELNU|nr:PREDICTED: uncharacterized protein LOC104607041 [Nelumbo nucifera]DAD41350.1 TPA_asm: hypothetical protein HUJ06_015673 [Nelumbo nucifera]